MVTVIGLKSGKEFIVSDGGYNFVDKITGAKTQIFLVPDESRTITIPETGNVEYYDEPADPVMIKNFKEGKFNIVQEEQHNDPNIL